MSVSLILSLFFFSPLILCYEFSYVHVIHFYKFPDHIANLECFIESTTRNLKNHPIAVHANQDKNEIDHYIKTNFKENITVIEHDIEEKLNQYQLVDWSEQVKHFQSQDYIQTLSDLFRIIVVYEMGGIYFDEDQLFLEAVELEKHIPFVTHDKKFNNINNSLIGFKKNDVTLKNIIESINHQRSDMWGFIGPVLFTR